MHELSLVQGLFRQLDLLAREHKTTSISNVLVEVGSFAGIVIDSFEFAFEVLAKENDLLKNAELEIVVPATQYRCLQCQHVTTSEKDMPGVCPKCEATLLVPDGGNDLILLQVEME